MNWCALADSPPRLSSGTKVWRIGNPIPSSKLPPRLFKTPLNPQQFGSLVASAPAAAVTSPRITPSSPAPASSAPAANPCSFNASAKLTFPVFPAHCRTPRSGSASPPAWPITRCSPWCKPSSREPPWSGHCSASKQTSEYSRLSASAPCLALSSAASTSPSCWQSAEPPSARCFATSASSTLTARR